MRIAFVWIGKTRDRHIAALADDYLERARRMARVEVIELRDRGGASSERGEPAVRDREAEALLGALADDDFVILCDERGSQLRSEEFARIISHHQERATRRVAFVIGGYLGVAPRIRERADAVIALSKMTFTHEMARLLLSEQLYRALTIVNGIPYQK
ncbi:MAG TPA: 23S rRNA (pseudouridine(1915)-N(3))-methyltransferase RlmH [Planctomycetota bacterium]|nr:23S rRNA (pseudouridine(1915)-N(3))-methyltransferase RlmH [Planctomycetota bacterium]